MKLAAVWSKLNQIIFDLNHPSIMASPGHTEFCFNLFFIQNRVDIFVVLVDDGRYLNKSCQ